MAWAFTTSRFGVCEFGAARQKLKPISMGDGGIFIPGDCEASLSSRLGNRKCVVMDLRSIPYREMVATSQQQIGGANGRR